MSAETETPEPVQLTHTSGHPSRPGPEWVRGTCPQCGDLLVSNCYYTQGRGYLIVWECWGSLGRQPTCDYRRVL